MAGGKPYRVGPSAIGMRYNPYGPSTFDNQNNIRMAFNQQDPRHRGLAGALVTRAREIVAERGLPALAGRTEAGDDVRISMGERWGFLRVWEVMVAE